MGQPIRGKSSHLCWQNGPKSANYVQNLEPFLRLKISWFHIQQTLKICWPIKDQGGHLYRRISRKSTGINFSFCQSHRQTDRQTWQELQTQNSILLFWWGSIETTKEKSGTFFPLTARNSGQTSGLCSQDFTYWTQPKFQGYAFLHDAMPYTSIHHFIFCLNP